MLFTCVKLCIEVNQTWAWEREDCIRIRVSHDAHVAESIPWVVIGCQPRSGYASVHIYWPAHSHIFVYQLDASWSAGLISAVIILSCVLGQWLLQFLKNFYINSYIISSIPNTNNLNIVVWFQAFISYINISYTNIWFQISISIQ